MRTSKSGTGFDSFLRLAANSRPSATYVPFAEFDDNLEQRPFPMAVATEDVVETEVEDGRVIISASRSPRAGWEQAARDLAAASQGLLDPATPTRFDEAEWRW